MSMTTAFTARALGLTALLLIAACSSGQSPEQAAVEFKGTDPAAAGDTQGGQSSGRGGASGGGSAQIVSYEGYQAAVARRGDTVASVADRVGVSASELGAYNGLPTDHELRAGDELVLPPRSEGYGGQARVETGTQLAEAPSATAQGTGGDDTGDRDSRETQAIEASPLETAPTAGTSGTNGGWSPSVAEQAIDRAGSAGQRSVASPPPSAGEPLPPDPQRPEALASPQLGQYQTPQGQSPEAQPSESRSAEGTSLEGESEGRVPAPRPVETITTPAEQPPERPAGETTQQATAQETTEQAAEPEVAAAPAASGDLSLIRPAQGPIVVGFQQGSGRMRNDGVDFAAPIGSPVVAAAGGEVALVSQSLGGLGNIVLVRHPGGYLTVYGRIDRVAVQKGDVVDQGQQIGTVASNPEPRMHFEVRKGAESLNPERFLASAS